MPSTYSPNLRIELIANGEQSGTWGTTTNANLGTLIEDAISGYVSVSVISANQALTAVDGGADQSRNMVINLTTTTSAVFNVYIPPAEKFYVIRNSSAYDATIYCSTVLGNTTAAGTGVTVLAGTTTMIFADGTDVASSLTAFSGNLVVSANSSSPALRVTQTGSGNSILVEDSANPDATPFVVTATGDVGIGTLSPTNLLSVAGNANITGNTTLGDASTDTVTVSGYMGVGGAFDIAAGIKVTSSSLQGSGQVGIWSEPTVTSAATTNAWAYRAQIKTAAASFTVLQAFGMRVLNPSLGAGSAITTNSGIRVDDQISGATNYGIESAVSSGTNKWNIYASGTAANYFAGNVGIGTSSPTEKLTLGAAGKIQVLRSDNARGGEFFADNTGTHLTALASGNDPLFLEAIGTGSVRVTTNATERMRIDSSGNVGIGTSSPAYNLEITGAASTAATLRVNGGSGANTNAILDLTGRGSGNQFNNADIRSIGQAANGGILTLNTDDTSGVIQERMRIDSSGNLGLGVTPSASWWASTKSIGIGRLGNGVFGATGDDEINIGANVINTGSGTYIYGATDTASLYRQVAAQHVWYYAASGTAGAALTLSEAMRLDASGRLLVGTTAQGTYGGNTAEFRGANIATLGSNVTGNLTLFTTDSQAANIGAVLSLGGVYVGTTPYAFGAIAARKSNGTSGNAQGYLQFYTTNSDNSISEKLRIDSSGNVGIGTSSPAKQLDLAANNTGITTGDPLNTLRFTDTDTTSAAGQPMGRVEWYSADTDTAGVKAYIQAQSTDGSPDADMIFATNHVSGGGTAERMRIQYDGNVGIGTSSPTNKLTVDGNTNITGNTTLGDASTDTVQVTGTLGVGAAAQSKIGVYIAGNTDSGSLDPYGVRVARTITSNATSGFFAYSTQGLSTEASAFTIANVVGFSAINVTKGAGSTITNQIGVSIADQTQGTNNYGIFSSVSSGTNKWNIYANGTAANYFAGNVGINNTAPATLLDITTFFSASSTRNGAIRIGVYTGGGNLYGMLEYITAFGMYEGSTYSISGNRIPIGTTASQITQLNGAIAFATNSGLTAGVAYSPTERMRLDSAGNLGLGVTPSAWSLGKAFEVGFLGTSVFAPSQTITNLTNNTYYSSGAYRYATTNAAAYYSVNTGAHQWYTAPSGTAGNAITFTQAMTLSAAGGLSIGDTTDPGAGGLRATGNVTLGDASTDTVTVNGTMGVGGTNSFPAQYGAHIKNSALTGTNIYGAVSEVTGPATATVSINAFTSIPTTSANAFTVGIVRGFQAINAIKGVGSTITNQHGVWVADQTEGTNNFGITSLVSSGTNKWNIYASGTAANYFAGNVLVGATSARTLSAGNNTPTLQVEGTTGSASTLSAIRNVNNSAGANLILAKTRGATVGGTTIVASGDSVGAIAFQGIDGTNFIEAASIVAQVDGTPGTNDMPGRLVFSTTADGGSSPTERMRINNAGITQFNSNLVMPYQGAPTSKAALATLTGAELITGILNTTGTTYTITLPTGTDIEGALTWSANNVSLDWWVINTASGTITIAANGNTTLGGLTIATGVSAHFRIRRTATNTFTVYRLS